MANKQAHEIMWSTHEVITKDKDEVSSFPTYCQLPPLGFSGHSGISPLSWEFVLPLQEIPQVDDPLMDMSIYDPSLDFLPTYNFPQGDYLYGFDGGLNIQNEMNTVGFLGFENESLPWPSFDENNYHQMIPNVNNEQKKEHGESIKKAMDNNNKPQREERNSSSKHLSREIISQYFYMPITQAAKQLNIGLTLLKKRCRELGIRRWPHRKLASLETLIKNVHELSNDESEGAEKKLREAIELLESEKKLMEELPDMQLMEKTKRLRQACFKANYKKRKVMSMNKNSSSSLPYSSTITHQASPNNNNNEVDGNGVMDDSSIDGEEIQSLLSDCFSSSNGMFF